MAKSNKPKNIAESYNSIFIYNNKSINNDPKLGKMQVLMTEQIDFELNQQHQIKNLPFLKICFSESGQFEIPEKRKTTVKYPSVT